jgi:GNAT superfamily N-acetyltransferase
MSKIMIRKARASDWDAFRSFLEHDQPVDSLEAAFKRFQKKLESPLHVVLVAELNGEIVGIAKAHEWDEYLMSGIKQIRFSSLGVSESHRRQGIGRALFEAARAWGSVNRTVVRASVGRCSKPLEPGLSLRVRLGLNCTRARKRYRFMKAWASKANRNRTRITRISASNTRCVHHDSGSR